MDTVTQKGEREFPPGQTFEKQICAQRAPSSVLRWWVREKFCLFVCLFEVYHVNNKSIIFSSGSNSFIFIHGRLCGLYSRALFLIST